MTDRNLETLLLTEREHLLKLNRIVIEAVEEEKLISNKLYDFEDTNPTLGSRISDEIAVFGGSWKFIISFLGFMAAWIILNIYILRQPFDAYPFILLNLMLSTVAALQAPIIMMSQNRKEQKDRQRAINDYLVNLKSEIEIRNMHQKLDLLIAEQMKTLFELQNVQVDMMKDLKNLLEKTEPDTNPNTRI